MFAVEESNYICLVHEREFINSGKSIFQLVHTCAETPADALGIFPIGSRVLLMVGSEDDLTPTFERILELLDNDENRTEYADYFTGNPAGIRSVIIQEFERLESQKITPECETKKQGRFRNHFGEMASYPQVDIRNRPRNRRRKQNSRNPIKTMPEFMKEVKTIKQTQKTGMKADKDISSSSDDEPKPVKEKEKRKEIKKIEHTKSKQPEKQIQKQDEEVSEAELTKRAERFVRFFDGVISTYADYQKAVRSVKNIKFSKPDQVRGYFRFQNLDELVRFGNREELIAQLETRARWSELRLQKFDFIKIADDICRIHVFGYVKPKHEMKKKINSDSEPEPSVEKKKPEKEKLETGEKITTYEDCKKAIKTIESTTLTISGKLNGYVTFSDTIGRRYFNNHEKFKQILIDAAKRLELDITMFDFNEIASDILYVDSFYSDQPKIRKSSDDSSPDDEPKDKRYYAPRYNKSEMEAFREKLPWNPDLKYMPKLTGELDLTTEDRINWSEKFIKENSEINNFAGYCIAVWYILSIGVTEYNGLISGYINGIQCDSAFIGTHELTKCLKHHSEEFTVKFNFKKIVADIVDFAKSVHPEEKEEKKTGVDRDRIIESKNLKYMIDPEADRSSHDERIERAKKITEEKIVICDLHKYLRAVPKFRNIAVVKSHKPLTGYVETREKSGCKKLVFIGTDELQKILENLKGTSRVLNDFDFKRIIRDVQKFSEVDIIYSKMKKTMSDSESD